MKTTGALRVQWIRGADRGPFQLTPEQWSGGIVDGYAWSADARELWKAFHDHWIAWDAATGKPVRRAEVPDNLRIARPSRAQVLAVEGNRESYNLPQFSLRAWSADLTRCVRERRHGSYPMLCDDTGRVVSTLDELDAPCVFSADGTLLLGRVRGDSSSAVVRASDGELVELHTCKLPRSRLVELLWPERDRVLINEQAPGHADDKLVCKTLDDRTLWTHAGYVRRVQVDVDGAVSAIDWKDHSIWRWDLHTGRVLAHVAPPEVPAGPLVFGEPNVGAMIEQLRAHPIVFTKLEPPVSERAAPPISDERDVARREYAHHADHPLEDIALVELVRDPDHAFVIYDVQTDGYEQRDPDAGSVWMYTSHLGRWNRGEQRWQWVHRELTSQRSYALSWDRSTIVETPTNVHYDVDSGLVCRAPAPPWTPDGRTFLATRHGITLARIDQVVEVYVGRAIVGDIAFEIGEHATTVDILDAHAVVIGTSAGRLARIDVLSSRP